MGPGGPPGLQNRVVSRKRDGRFDSFPSPPISHPQNVRRDRRAAHGRPLRDPSPPDLVGRAVARPHPAGGEFATICSTRLPRSAFDYTSQLLSTPPNASGSRSDCASHAGIPQ